MSHADEKNCRYCHGNGWKKDGFGGEMPCAGDPSVEQPSTPPPTIDDFKKWKAEPAQTAGAKPVQPWSEKEDDNYVAYLCFSNGGLHIADSDTDKAFKVWRARDIKKIIAAHAPQVAPSSSASDSSLARASSSAFLAAQLKLSVAQFVNLHSVRALHKYF